MTSSIPYRVAVRYLYPEWGLVIGTLGDLVISGLYSLIFYRFIMKRLS